MHDWPNNIIAMLNINIGRISDLYDIVVNQVDERLVNLVLDNIDYFVENLNSNIADIIINRSDIDSIYNVIDNLREQIGNNILSSNLSGVEQRLNALQLLQSYLNDDIVKVVYEDVDELVDEDVDEVSDDLDEGRERFDDLVEILREYAVNRRLDVRSNVRDRLRPIITYWYYGSPRDNGEYLMAINQVYTYILRFINKIHNDVNALISSKDNHVELLREYMSDYPTRLGDRMVELYQNNMEILGPVGVSEASDRVVRRYGNMLPTQLKNLYLRLLNYGDINNLVISDTNTRSHDRFLDRLDNLLTQ